MKLEKNKKMNTYHYISIVFIVIVLLAGFVLGNTYTIGKYNEFNLALTIVTWAIGLAFCFLLYMLSTIIYLLNNTNKN